MSQPWSAPQAAGPITWAQHVPGSKSITNRAFILAALADGPSTLRAPLVSRDSQLMEKALESMGVRFEHDGEDIHVHLRGRTFTLRHIDPARRYAESDTAGGADVARAPMPGTVVRLAAEIGQSVAAGDPLLVIESMKLETTIRATHPARVAAIHVAAGQSFDRDAVLGGGD